MNRKAISTLFSTVMIICLLTLATIAAVSFAGAFIDVGDKYAKELGERQGMCAQEVAARISNACYLNQDKIKLTIENNGIKLIDRFIIRLYSKSSNAKVNSASASLNQFMIESYELEWPSNANQVVMIEALPTIREGTCQNAKASFGSMQSSLIKPCHSNL